MSYEIIKQTLVTTVDRDKRLKPNSAKKLAQINGQVYFVGAICKHGHERGLRYTKGGQCVDCVGVWKGKAINPKQRSNENHKLSVNAAANGQTTYIPEKSCKAGHFLRFVNSNNCVECDKITRNKHEINRKFNRIAGLYALSKEKYLQLVKDQNSSCKLCLTFYKDHFKLHVDHCHNTNIVRGLLCGTCNQGIGGLKHSPELLRKAALYCEAAI